MNDPNQALDMVISEPATVLTDYLITLACSWFAFRLYRRRAIRPVRLWAAGFLSVAGAALAGGTFHGFAGVLPARLISLLWNSTILLIGLAAGLMIAGTYVAAMGAGRPWLLAGLALTGIGLTLLALEVSPHPAFNQNDLYHCVQLVGFYFFFRGAGTLGQRTREG